MFLELNNPKNMDLKDLSIRELITIVPLLILIFWIGLYPKPFMKTFDASVSHLVSKVSPNNFRPKQDHNEGEHHAALITKTELAELSQKLKKTSNN